MITLDEKEKYTPGLSKRLTINGETKIHKTYYVPIERLYYNDLNGRIATYIEEYDATHSDSIVSLRKNDVTKYNDVIAEYIKDSANDNRVSFNNTKADIKTKQQKEPGVILTDGRIIDGNRRFTAIRELYAETGDPKFEFFECVILETPEDNDKAQWKIIKSLELNLQYNEDEKREYNKIDYLVSLYRNLMNPETRIFDNDKAYIYAVGEKKKKSLNKDKATIEVMLDYLEWRNIPKMFYILKNEKLDGPLEELGNLKLKLNNNEWADKKDSLFTFLSLNKSGDRTRDMRELANSAKVEGKLFADFTQTIFNEENISTIMEGIKVLDSKVATPEETKTKTESIENATKLIIQAYTDSKYDADISALQNTGYDNLVKILNSIKKMDSASLKNLEDGKKSQAIATIDECVSRLNKFKENL